MRKGGTVLTEKLYDTDAYLQVFSAKVLSCVPVGEGFDVVLDRTAFFPEGGGQYGDAGSLGGVRVTDTQIRGEVIYHRTDVPLTVGETVEGQIDFFERFRRMQNHSGEHIVSGIVHSLFGYENVGFHLGADFMTMDYSGELSPTDLEAVEAAANRAVWDNREIICRYPAKEELKTLPYRSKKELTGAIRIVCVTGIDLCACCAPHVKRTGEVGAIVISDAIRWKGGTRLTVHCGPDALREHEKLRTDERALSALFSAPRGENASVAERMQRDFADLRRRYGLLQRDAALLRLAQLPEGEKNLCFVLPDGDADTLRAAANEGIKKCSGAFVCLTGADTEGYKYVIAASGNLRAKAKEINAALQGRGGGSETMIQGSFAASEKEIRDYFKEFTI